MNINAIIKKLQLAILQTGLIIKVGTTQFYSKEQGRMITVRILSTPIYMQKQNGEWRDRDYEILRSASVIDIVKCLQEIWEQVKEWNNDD